MRNLQTPFTLPVRLLCLLVAMVISSCGGGQSNDSMARASMSAIRAMAASTSISTSSSTSDRVIVTRIHGDTAFLGRPSADVLLKWSFALLDSLSIPSKLLNCGTLEYASGGGGTPDGPMTWDKFEISASDLQKAKTVGFEEFDPSSDAIFGSPERCGDLAAAMDHKSRLFTMAFVAFPSYFPGWPIIGTWEGFDFWYFEETGNFVAVKDGRVYLHNGRDWQLLDVGSLSDFIKDLP